MTDHRDGWPRTYILVGHMPVAVDMMTWAQSLGRNEARVVAQTTINDRCWVSTVFLGLDHNHSRRGGEPILFETMVFGGPLDGEMMRYATWDQAERGHAEMLTEVRKAVAQVDILARDAKADHTG